MVILFERCINIILLEKYISSASISSIYLVWLGFNQTVYTYKSELGGGIFLIVFYYYKYYFNYNDYIHSFYIL